MLLPEKSVDLLERAIDLKKQCFASDQARSELYASWRSYLFFGSGDPSVPALLNKCGPHADRLHSYLFSPAECRFLLEFGQRADGAWHKRELDLSRHLTKEFHSSQVDMAFGDAVFWSLPLGASFVKLGIKTELEETPEADTSWVRSLWRRGRRRPVNSRGLVADEKRQVFSAFDPYVILPSSMGVFNETVNGLDRQEVICQRTPITRFELARRLRYHPDALDIMERVNQQSNARSAEDETSFMHQVITGNPGPVSGGGYGTGGSQSDVRIFQGAPQPQLSPEAIRNMVWLYELWIIDDERGDYTTVQYVEPDILIEGGLVRRNLFIPGHHPYTLVQPNEQQGYFWGRSEFADLFRLQDAIAERLADIVKIGKLQASPPHAMMGFSGNVDEMKRAFRSQNGLLVSDMPNGKIEKLAPDLPTDAYQNLDALIRYYDEIAGFSPIMQGQGEAGVRAGMHAQSLQRSASARIRDRALRVERQCAELGSLCFDAMAAKDPTAYGDDGYLLADVPDDRGVTVDAHSASPAFTEDNKSLLFALNKAGALTPKGLLMGTHPAMLDQFLQQLEEKQAAEQKMIAEHPELLTKGKKKR